MPSLERVQPIRSMPEPAFTSGPLRVLAVDDEYLIALDVQELLSALADWLVVDTATTEQAEDSVMAGQNGVPYHVVLIDPVEAAGALPSLLDAAQACQTQVVFGVADGDGFGIPANNRHMPRAIKPYSEQSLLLAIAAALEDAQPTMARAVTDAILPSGP